MGITWAVPHLCLEVRGGGAPVEAGALCAPALQPRRGTMQPLRKSPAAPIAQQTDLQRGVALDPLLLLLRSIAGGTRGEDGGVSPAEERVARSPARDASHCASAGAQGVEEALLKRAPVGLYRLQYCGVVPRTGAGRGIQAGGGRVVQNRSRVQHQSVGPGRRGGMRPPSSHHYRRAAGRGAGLLQGDKGAAAAVEGAAPRERCDGGEAPVV